MTKSHAIVVWTGIAEVEPGVVLLSYDKVGARRVGDVQKVYAVRITVRAGAE